jgi:CRP-like cAMP-binding protein
MHLENLPPEFDATFSMAVAGKRYPINQGSYHSYIIKTFQILSDTFENISHDWTTALMSNFVVQTYNVGDVIVKQGEESKGLIYIILSGSCSVMVHDGKVLSEKARKEAGDFVGEMAVLDTNKIRNASIVARTPVTLCAIEERLFHEFLIQENRVDQMKNLWQTRSELERNFPFNKFSDNVNDRLSQSGKRVTVEKDEIVIEQGTKSSQFFIVLSGRFAIYHNKKKINELGPGSMFGEYASLAQTVRNATVKSMEKSLILRFESATIEKLVQSIPILNFHLRQLMKEREEFLKLADEGR